MPIFWHDIDIVDATDMTLYNQNNTQYYWYHETKQPVMADIANFDTKILQLIPNPTANTNTDTQISSHDC